jgi:hypothetical protein
VNDIQNYVPKEADLEYPRLLHVTSGTKSEPTTPIAGTTDLFECEVLFQGWYPTLYGNQFGFCQRFYRLVDVRSL